MRVKDWVLGVNRGQLDPKSFGDKERVLGRVAGCGCDCERETGYQDGRDMGTEDVVVGSGEAEAAAGAGAETGGAVGVEVVVGVVAPGTEGSGADSSAASNAILS